jgi:hypothetical protein
MTTMDTTKKKHSAMDHVIRNYYGNVHAGRRRGLHDMEKVIRGYYAPTDRRSAVLRNYYGTDGDAVKRHYHRFHHVLGNYYGHLDLYGAAAPAIAGGVAAGASAAAAPGPVAGPGAAGIVASKSFDDGEVLVQRNGTDSADSGAIPFEEYVVAKSAGEEPVEEYVVYNQSFSSGEEPCEEYVVYNQSLSAGDGDAPAESGPADLDVYDKQVLKELNIDISNPLAQTKSFARSRTFDTPDAKAPDAKAPDENEFLTDLQSIMSLPGPQPQPGYPSPEQQRNATRPAAVSQSAEPPLPANEHAIFDRIARSMQFANAYDLGTVELDNRFADFDNFYDRQEKPVPATKGPEAPTAVSASTDSGIPNPADFIKDLDSILRGDAASGGQGQQQPFGGGGSPYGDASTFGGNDTFFSLSAPEPDNPDWPPKPTNIRPYTSAERIAKFTEFSYIPDPGSYNGDGIKVLNDWDRQNIVMVDIPQLKDLKYPKLQFHRLGATQLQDLWKAWEDAGLLNRITSFDGSYATRYIRHTEDRNPRPLSNHAWGTAFDINAAQNAFGQEPAMVGKPGCVRELVEIANQHGFYWGGHFKPHKDGMHFELGKIIS